MNATFWKDREFTNGDIILSIKHDDINNQKEISKMQKVADVLQNTFDYELTTDDSLQNDDGDYIVYSMTLSANVFNIAEMKESYREAKKISKG